MFPDFELNRDNGIISMKEGIKLDEEIKVSSYIYEGGEIKLDEEIKVSFYIYEGGN